MSLTAEFDGKVTMYTTRKGFPGPSVQPVAFEAQFDGTAWQVAPADFQPVVIPGIVAQGQTVTLTVTLEAMAQGTADAASGQASLQAQFRFEFSSRSLPVNLASSLPLKLSSAPNQASWPGGPTLSGQGVSAASGALCLAGVGAFVGGPLGNDRAAILLEGTFTPQPW